jgi:hypothetical protein
MSNTFEFSDALVNNRCYLTTWLLSHREKAFRNGDRRVNEFSSSRVGFPD